MIYSIANQLAAVVPGLKEILRQLDQNKLEQIQSVGTLFERVIAGPCRDVKPPAKYGCHS